jgi:hypothetical protein
MTDTSFAKGKQQQVQDNLKLTQPQMLCSVIVTQIINIAKDI